MLQKLKKMGYLFWLTVLAAIVLAGLTIYQAYDKVQSDNDAIKERNTADQERIRADDARKESKISQEKAERYLNDLKSANEKIEKLNKKSLLKADEIIKKNEEVIKAQNETIKSVTGFGYPIAMVGRTSGNNASIFVTSDTKYNLKNLSVSIFDFTDNLKKHLKGNALSIHKMREYLVAEESIVMLPPNQVFEVKYSFNINLLKAFEMRIVTDHGEFREFLISKFDENTGLVEKRFFKFYEIDRKTQKWELIAQYPIDKSADALFENYFIMHNYKITTEN